MSQINPAEYESFQNIEDLFARLSERVFLKTKIDIVYSDYMNWERGNLLMNQYEKGETSPKKLTYFEYIWAKLVDEFRRYNFSYAEITLFKEEFFRDLTKEIPQVFKENEDMVREKLSDHISPEEVDTIDYSNVSYNSPYVCLFYTALSTVIAQKEELFILISKDDPQVFDLVSTTNLRDQERFDLQSNVEYLTSKTHLNISFSNIIAQFLTTGSDDISKLRNTILSSEEHKILKIVRNKTQAVKSIKIKYDKDKPILIEIKEMKKVQVESRLLDHIKKGEYLNIEITSHDGKILKFENTKKIKL